MAKLSGIFANFPNLDNLSSLNIVDSLKARVDIHVVENLIGNLILFPQTIPTSKIELALELAVFKQALLTSPNFVWDKRNKKIIITRELAGRFPPISNLVSIIIDALDFEEITFIALKDESVLKTLGSFIPFSAFKNKEEIPSVYINGKEKKLTPGIMNILPVKEKQVIFKIGNEKEIEIMGGELGLLIDLKVK